MQYHSPEGRKEPVFFAANDVSGARHVALKITNIDEAFLHIKSMPDTRLINETDDYQVFQISETYPDEVHFFDQDMKEMDEMKQESVCVTRVVRSDSCFLFILLFFSLPGNAFYRMQCMVEVFSVIMVTYSSP